MHSMSEVPIINIQLAEVRVQTGQSSGRVLSLDALQAAHWRNWTQEIGKSLSWSALYLKYHTEHNACIAIFLFLYAKMSEICPKGVKTHLFEE